MDEFPIKIAYVTNNCTPMINGVSVAIDTLQNGLQLRGHIVKVIAPSHKNSDESPNAAIRLSSINLTNKLYYPIAFCTTRKLRKIFDSHEFDIIHSHHPFGLGSTALSASCRNIRIPIVFTYHTLYEFYLHYVPMLDVAIFHNIVRTAAIKYAQRCDYVIAPCYHVGEFLSNHINVEKIFVIRTPPREPLPHKIGDAEEGSLLLVSRLSREKNIDLALKAFSEIRKTMHNAVLTIAGDGPERTRLLRLSKNLGISESVCFHGALCYEDLSKLYATSSCILFTSTTETQALVLWEAYSYGVNFVAVDSSASREVSNELAYGIVCDSTPISMAESVIRAVGMKYNHHTSRVVLGKEIDKIEKLYESII